jgi:hypothetical protein
VTGLAPRGRLAGPAPGLAGGAFVPLAARLAHQVSASLDTIAEQASWSEVAIAAVVADLATSPPGPDPACRDLIPGQQHIMCDVAARVRVANRSCLIWGHPAGLLWLFSPAPWTR